MNIIYTTADTFTDDYVSNLRTKSNLEAFKQKYRSCDLLLIDDIQFMANKSETQQELFHTFNSLYNQNKQIIFTSDRPPKELNGIEQRLISRFEQGLLADIAPPEYETRIAIIKRKAELYGMNLPDSIVDFLADKLKTNIRQLEGAITKINALTLVTGSTPTLNMAQQVVRDIQSNHEPIPLTVEKIIAEVGKIYSVTPRGYAFSETFFADKHRKTGSYLCGKQNHRTFLFKYRSRIRQQRSFHNCLCYK